MALSAYCHQILSVAILRGNGESVRVYPSWHIALADNRISPYHSHLFRRVFIIPFFFPYLGTDLVSYHFSSSDLSVFTHRLVIYCNPFFFSICLILWHVDDALSCIIRFILA